MEFSTPLLSGLALSITLSSCNPKPIEDITSITQKMTENSLSNTSKPCWVHGKEGELTIIDQGDGERIGFCKLDDGTIVGTNQFLIESISKELI